MARRIAAPFVFARKSCAGGPETGRYLGTVTPVILSLFPVSPILASPTTEPGRRGWERGLRSLPPTPHFFALRAYSVTASAELPSVKIEQ